MSLAGITAVAFDLDSTLCFYGVTVEGAMAQALARLGQRADLLGDLSLAAARYEVLWAEEEKKRAPAGVVRERAWERLLEGRGILDRDLACALAEEYAAVRMPSIRLFDGVRELLRDLRRSYDLGLLTNGQPDMQWPKIKSLGIEGLFDAIVVSGEVGVYKPDRGAFDVLLDRLGVVATQALYVGDSQENDVAGAKAAGMRVAWVRTDEAGEAEGVAPDLVVDGAVELRGMLL